MKKNRPQNLSPLQQKRLWRVSALMVLVAVLWLLFAPGYGLVSLLGQRSELKRLQDETEALAVENKNLAEEVERLKDDPKYLEDIARKDYGLLKPNERVYDFSDPDKEKD